MGKIYSYFRSWEAAGVWVQLQRTVYGKGADGSEPGGVASRSDRRAGARLLAGLPVLFPRIHTVIADAGHESRR